MKGTAFFLWLGLAWPAVATPDYGLIRNETGLPLVFPLQIRTDPGADMLVTLRDFATGETALTARLEGGAFFRILVPKGTFAVALRPVGNIADVSPSITLPHPLKFQVVGASRKAGHLIDLRGDDPATVRPIGLCQTFGYDSRASRDLRQYFAQSFDVTQGPEPLPQRSLSERFCD